MSVSGYTRQWQIAAELSTTSQVNLLVRARSGGMCHHCLPTWYVASKCEGGKDMVLCESCAFRCTFGSIRHVFYQDRPRYLVESIHKPLIHRCQHVIASDRDKAKGQLANVCLTHILSSIHGTAASPTWLIASVQS